MDIKKLEKILDKAIRVLSDNDDKKDQERYITLQNIIEETQIYLETGAHTNESNNILYTELVKGIDKFKKDRILFIIFLIIFCGLIFCGIFYVTYSHFYEHFYDGGHIVPSVNTTKKTTDVSQTTTDDNEVSTSTTTKVSMKDDTFVTVIFDNSELIDLENMMPVDDSVGLNSTPITWKLDSSLSKGSKDYIITYAIDLIDQTADIQDSELMDVSNLKYNLLAKKKGKIVYDSGIQLLKDYPEVSNGIRPIVTGETYNQDEIVEFELRMWLDSATNNSQQGKKYRFKINVDATYDFIS